MKIKTAVFPMMALCCASGFAATGDCIGHALSISIGGSKSVTLVNEWDPDMKEWYNSGVYYLKLVLTKGTECTVAVSGAFDFMDVMTDFNDENAPKAFWDSYTGSTSYAMLTSVNWDYDDPDRSTFYICISGDIGATARVSVSSGIVLPTGMEENPQHIAPSTTAKAASGQLIGGTYYFKANLKGGSKYMFGLNDGAAKVEILTPDEDGYVRVDRYRGFDTATAQYDAFELYPETDAEYLFCVVSQSAAIVLIYSVAPSLLPSEHSVARTLTGNDNFLFTPGKMNADGSDYHDSVIDESLFTFDVNCDPSGHLPTYCVETAGATTNLLAMLYDANGLALVRKVSAATATTPDIQFAFSLPVEGRYYIGLCENLANEHEESPSGNPVTFSFSKLEGQDAEDESIIKFHAISFDANGGSCSESRRILAEGTFIGTLPTPSRTGYTFWGWLPSVAEIVPDTNVTYIAQWAINRYTVTFNANGGTGSTSCEREYGSTLGTLPPVPFYIGHEFLGWYKHECGGEQITESEVVTADVTYYALWRRVYAIGEVVGVDAGRASLPWSVGTNGVAEANGYDDATVAGGKSLKFTVADAASAWVEAVVTNACRASFDWKCSCEPLVKGKPYDYLAFAVDGEQQAFICGETGWTSVTNYVTGEGEHVLRWTFQRDEDGSAGEDCSWLANVKVTPSVTLSFADGGATSGTVPEPVMGYADENIMLPTQGSLAWPKHTFLGWSDGVNVYSAGGNYLVHNADIVLTAVWEENEPETFGEYLNWPEHAFTTGGDAAWTRVKGVSADGYALRSGAITHSQTSRLETVVSGPGTVTFSCKVAGEIVKKTVYDGLAFCIDGMQQGELMGNANWAERTFEVTGEGSHTLSWLYVKDDGDMVDVGEDCAWVDGVTWSPAGGSADTVVDMGGGKSVTVPGDWLTNITARIEAEGGDTVTALASKAANGRMSVAECYVVGVDPEKADEDFKITSITIGADGTPVVEFDPPQARWNVSGARAVLKGAVELGGDWQTVTEENKAGFRFFKVVVELP